MASEIDQKPLNFTPDPKIGYTVTRRADGGMHFTFTDASPETIEHWRNFALQHLYDSDRLTRNLYDLRQIEQLPPEAIQLALEANSDPLTRNIRLAVLVATEPVREAAQHVADLSVGGGVEMKIFTDLPEAEKWLSRPLTII